MFMKRMLLPIVVWIFGAGLIYPGAVAARRARMAIAVPGKSEIVFMTAKEKGYYSDEGLDVELIVTGGINRLALIAGEVDFSSSGSASIVPVLRGAPLRVLYTAFYRTTLWLYAKADLRDVKSLKGKRIAISRVGDTSEVYLREVLRRYGLEAGRDVVVLAAGQPVNRYAALASGTVDAAVVADPFNFLAKEAGFRELVSFLSDDTDIVHLSGSIVVRDALLQTDRTLAEKFIRGSLRALRYVRNNRAGVLPILARNLGITDELAGKNYDMFRPAMTADGTVNLDMQKKAVDLQLKVIGSKESPPMEKFFDFSMTQRLSAELDGRR
jgi:NitT/TauT family transport system substrate-binding protein